MLSLWIATMLPFGTAATLIPKSTTRRDCCRYWRDCNGGKKQMCGIATTWWGEETNHCADLFEFLLSATVDSSSSRANVVVLRELWRIFQFCLSKSCTRTQVRDFYWDKKISSRNARFLGGFYHSLLELSTQMLNNWIILPGTSWIRYRQRVKISCQQRGQPWWRRVLFFTAGKSMVCHT